MKLDIKRKLWRCSHDSCRTQVSMMKKTFFEASKVSVNKILQLCYLYLLGTPVNGLVEATSLSSRTITSWLKYTRQILGDFVDFNDTMIGGEGVIVEIDETKLGKRKYHRGHRVDGVWVVAGIERTPEKKCFAIEVEARDAPTMHRIISSYVRPGSIIHTDMWKAYKKPCEELGLIHFTVNHSVTFKDPITCVHTNTIEGLNNGLKYQIKARNRTRNSIRHHLLYFIWRRLNKKTKWLSFLEAIKNTIYI